MTAGYGHSCALDDNGITCWGTNANGRSTVPDSLVNPTQVVAGGLSTCALDDNGVTCWGKNTSKQTDVPTLYNPSSVDIGAHKHVKLHRVIYLV